MGGEGVRESTSGGVGDLLRPPKGETNTCSTEEKFTNMN